MAKIRGMNMIAAKKVRLALIGRDNFDKVINALSPKTREVFSGVIVPSHWYDLSLFAEWCEVCMQVCYGGNEKEYVKDLLNPSIGEHIVLLFKSFLRMNKPGVVVKRIAYITSFYFQGVSVEYSSIAPCRAMLIYKGLDKEHYIIELLIKGWWTKILELMEVSDIDVEIKVSIKEDKGYSQFLVSWRE